MEVIMRPRWTLLVSTPLWVPGPLFIGRSTPSTLRATSIRPPDRAIESKDLDAWRKVTSKLPPIKSFSKPKCGYRDDGERSDHGDDDNSDRNNSDHDLPWMVTFFRSWSPGNRRVLSVTSTVSWPP